MELTVLGSPGNRRGVSASFLPLFCEHSAKMRALPLWDFGPIAASAYRLSTMSRLEGRLFCRGLRTLRTDETVKFVLSGRAMVVLASTSLANDYSDWIAKGYRWSAVWRPYAYLTKEDTKNERSRPGSKSVSETIGRAYYLRPGKVVLVVETDAASGLSKIRMGGKASDLWTAIKT
jgi:hypothetical protein